MLICNFGPTAYVTRIKFVIVIVIDKIFFVIYFLQGLKLCAQKTEVVAMDDISIF